MSHSEWREGCGRMLPLQRLDVITSLALPPFATMTLTSNFLQLPQPSGRRQPSARNPRMRRSKCANTDLKPCKHRHTNVAQKLKSCAETNTIFQCKTGLIAMEIWTQIQDKIWKRSTRDKGTSWKSILENHATNPQLFLMTELK